MNWAYWLWLAAWIGWVQSFIRSVPPMVRSYKLDKQSSACLEQMKASTVLLTARGFTTVEELEHHRREFDRMNAAFKAIHDQWQMELDHGRRLSKQQFVWLGLVFLTLIFTWLT